MTAIPDVATTVVGWQSWRVADTDGGPRLVSPDSGRRWAAVEAATATECGAADHSVPALGCDCGLHAVSDLGRVRPATAEAEVLGLVALWGEVVESTHGWRASHGYPRLLLADPTVPGSTRAEWARRYGIPVHASPLPLPVLVALLAGTDRAEGLRAGTVPWADVAAWVADQLRKARAEVTAARQAEEEAGRREFESIFGPPDAVLGWRSWALRTTGNQPRLVSSVQGSPWPAARANVATCSHGHRPPATECGCGLYAVTDLARVVHPTDGTGVLGLVTLWGEVVRGTHGWRASHGYPHRLYTDPGVSDESRARLADRYMVPVHRLRLPLPQLVHGRGDATSFLSLDTLSVGEVALPALPEPIRQAQRAADARREEAEDARRKAREKNRRDEERARREAEKAAGRAAAEARRRQGLADLETAETHLQRAETHLRRAGSRFRSARRHLWRAGGWLCAADDVLVRSTNDLHDAEAEFRRVDVRFAEDCAEWLERSRGRRLQPWVSRPFRRRHAIRCSLLWTLTDSRPGRRLDGEMRDALRDAERPRGMPTRLRRSTVLIGPDRRQQIRVLPRERCTHLALVENGEISAERHVDTEDLLARQRAEWGLTYAGLAGLLTDA